MIDRTEISQWLQRGDAAQVARECRLKDEKAIYRYLDGTIKKPPLDVMLKLIDKAAKNKAKALPYLKSLQLAGTKS